jgi:hypothetical protein
MPAAAVPEVWHIPALSLSLIDPVPLWGWQALVTVSMANLLARVWLGILTFCTELRL